MNRKVFLFLLLSALALASIAGLRVQSQSGGLIRVQEVDGTPGQFVRTLVFPNGSLLASGSQITVGGGGSSSIIGGEAGDAILLLQADESDDNGDDWRIMAAASGNALTFSSDTSGSQVVKLTLSTAGVITLADSETLTNASDKLTLLGDDAATAFGVTGFEASTATLTLFADEDDDATDGWFFTATASGTLTIGNDSSAAGTAVTKLTITGSTGALTLADSETFTNASDVITFGFDDAAAEIRIQGFEAGGSTLTLQADESDDNGDDWQVTNSTGNQLLFNNDTSGSQVLKFGVSTAGAFVINGSFNFAADVAANDDYLITLAPAPTAYATGMVIVFTAATANTGASTVNVNSLGVKNLLSFNNVTPPDNYIEAGSVVMAVYDGTSFQLIQPDANP